jgi:hypothetical protein
MEFKGQSWKGPMADSCQTPTRVISRIAGIKGPFGICDEIQGTSSFNTSSSAVHKRVLHAWQESPRS